MRREWFQQKRVAPHYDLTASRRAAAVKLGAIEVGRRESVAIWRARREAVANPQPALANTQPEQSPLFPVD
jgi:hypothetical protein